MYEYRPEIGSSITRSPWRKYALGRQVVALERQRSATFERFFGQQGSDPTCRSMHLYGRFPLLQPRNLAAIAGIFLDELAEGAVKLRDLASSGVEAQVNEEVFLGLCPANVRVVEQVDHYRYHNYREDVPGDFHGWFVGRTTNFLKTSCGVSTPVLLQPGVVLTSGDDMQAAPALTTFPAGETN